MGVSNIVLSTAQGQIDAKLRKHAREMDVAFNTLGELSISMKINLKPSKLPNHFDLKTAVSFVSDRVKDETDETVSVAQLNMFDDEE